MIKTISKDTKVITTVRHCGHKKPDDPACMCTASWSLVKEATK